MSWPRGRTKKKTGGRAKGSKNKGLRSASEIFERLAFNSLEKAIELIRDESLEKQHRIGLLKELIKYQFPQLRAVEHSGLPEQVIRIETKREEIKLLLADPSIFNTLELIEKKLKEPAVAIHGANTR